MSRALPDRRLTGPAIVLVTGLMIAAAVTAASAIVHQENERRLLEQQTAEAAAVLSAAIPAVEAPLAAAANAADVSGDGGAFDAVLGPSIETSRFTAAVLFSVDGDHVAQIGDPADLIDDNAQVEAMISQALDAPGMAVIDSLVADERRIGYAYATSGGTSSHVVYAEGGLPEQRTGVPRSEGVFNGLDFALYLDGVGDSSETTLLYTSVDDPPITGRSATETVAFGDRSLTLVMSTDATYGGALARFLPWIAAIGGAAIAVIAALLTHRLLQRRRHAELLANINNDLYEQQRSQADTLRQSLLPRQLPSPPGLDIAVGYWPADASNEIGGDFYDIFHIRDDTWAIAIGDICGQGIDAATLTGLTRHTIRAAARHLADPSDVLTWVHEAVSAHGAHTYCTVCFAFLHFEPNGQARIEVALGGHPPPILIRHGQTQPLGDAGTILGLIPPTVHTTTHHLETDDTVVFYTDGVTDAPGGQHLDHDDLHVLLAGLHEELPATIREGIRREITTRRPHGSNDDTAVLIIRVAPDAETTMSDDHHAEASALGGPVTVATAVAHG